MTWQQYTVLDLARVEIIFFTGMMVWFEFVLETVLIT